MAISIVENQLFKVHRHFLIERSWVFRDMFAVPKVVGEATEGTCDEQPIPLSGVNVKEFKTLLKFFYFYYPPYANYEDEIDRTRAQGVQEANLHLLSISHRFLFDDMFRYAASRLRPQEVPILERIRLGDRYGLQDWLFSAYEELLGRPESLKEEEVDALGANRVVRFIRAKEDMHSEYLAIANTKCQAQSDRALSAEQKWRNQNFSPLQYQLPPTPIPAPVQTVVKYFLEA